MAAVESAAVPSGLAAAGITIFGMATGIDPAILVAGIVGGWWALIQFDGPVGVLPRVSFVALSGFISAGLTPFLSSIALPLLEKSGLPVPALPLNMAMSLVIGLLAIKFIGPRVVKIAGQAADKAEAKV